MTISAFASLVLVTASFFGQTSAELADHSSALKPCPPHYIDGGYLENWTVYHDVERLSSCHEALLLDFALYNPLEDPETHVSIRASTGTSPEEATTKSVPNACLSQSRPQEVTLDMGVSTTTITAAASKDHALEVVRTMQNFLGGDVGCNITSLFAQVESVALGIYVGANLERHGAAESITEKFIETVATTGVSPHMMIQYCGSDSDHVLGLAVEIGQNSLATVQSLVRGWSERKCVDVPHDTTSSSTVTLHVAPATEPQNFNPLNSTLDINDLHRGHQVHFDAATPEAVDSPGDAQKPLAAGVQATCSSIQVVSGDSCATLAVKCKLSAADFTKLNPNICAGLQPGQYVCCSAGSLPDLTPKPGANGVCAKYSVAAGDSCFQIASSHMITVAQIETFNAKTWGWMGCANVQLGQTICLSTGAAPLPAPLPGAICGPQMPGTALLIAAGAIHASTPALYNPCPLNACCNIWGQCGTVDEFCIPTKSITGAPGTAAPGTNGCISNCGTSVINNAQKPAEWKQIVYYEGWAMERPCLKVDMDDINDGSFTTYTHVHFSFAQVTANYEVDVSAVQTQFDKFVKSNAIGPGSLPRKRILSFGGWSFSTDFDSAPIFREGVTDSDRQKFATNVANFIKLHNLDGVDFDWEYPGAPDIPGIPPGGKNDGINYLYFLKLVRTALTGGQSLSIAAPASYWYLKGFPIQEISVVVDYIVYMTYDLHGQWDYGSHWASAGCPSGDCLRSHVNLTETLNSLSMITKAGVQASKVVVGVSSYGRSFKMSSPGCSGPMCTFVGPESAAKPGKCTKTAGYIADAEIDEIISTNPSARMFHDSSSDSDILVYDNTEWVAYMSPLTKTLRAKTYWDMNFAGTTDWAVDLRVPSCSDIEGHFGSFDSILNANGKILGPCACANAKIIAVEKFMLDAALAHYTTLLNSEYDDKFKAYSRYLSDLVPLQLGWYMAANGSQHFTCTVTRTLMCCRDCQNAQNCPNGCDHDPACVKGPRTVTLDHCPQVFPDPQSLLPPDQLATEKVHYTPKDSTSLQSFLQAIYRIYGIPKEWISFGQLLTWVDPSCQGGSTICPNAKVYWDGFPIRGNINIYNPKPIVAEALKQLTAIRALIDKAQTQSTSHLTPESTNDIVYGITVPVMVFIAGVDAMQAVQSISETITAVEQREMIRTFLSGIKLIMTVAGHMGVEGDAVTAINAALFFGSTFETWDITSQNLPEHKKDVISNLIATSLGIPGEKPFNGATTIWEDVKLNDQDIFRAFGAEATALIQKVLTIKAACPK